MQALAMLASGGAQELFVTHNEKGMRELRQSYHPMCFALLAEAVMRACRAYIRQHKATPSELVAKALGIGDGVDTEAFHASVRGSAKRIRSFYGSAHRLTNCPPTAVVGVLGLLERLHRGMVRWWCGNCASWCQQTDPWLCGFGCVCVAWRYGLAVRGCVWLCGDAVVLAQGAEDVVAALQSGALSMKSFLHDHLPGAKGHATTLALYLQGCRFHKASQRQVPLRLGAACVRVCACVLQLLVAHGVSRARVVVVVGVRVVVVGVRVVDHRLR